MIGAVTASAAVAYLLATLFILIAMRRANRIAADAAKASSIGTQQALAETRESNELTKRSVETAQASLDETRKSNLLTQRNLEIAERALEFSRLSFELAHQPSLHLVKVETTSGNSSGESILAARVYLRNTGSSDAHDVLLSGRFNAGPVNIDEIDFPEEGAGQSQGYVAPGIVVHGVIQVARTQQLWDANASSGRLYLICGARYGDDFGAHHAAVFMRVWTNGEWATVREKRRRIPAGSD